MSLDAVNSYLGGLETSPHGPTLRDYVMFYPEVACVFVLRVNYRDSAIA